MNGTRAAIAAFTLLIATIVVASPAELRFVLDEPSVLPGTPTGLTVTITNRGDATVHLPPFLWMVAQDEEGRRFNVPAFGLSTEGRSFSIPADVRTILAGATRELRFDVSPAIVGTMFLTDERIARPGTYRLQLALAASVNAAGELEGGILSNEEVLTVTVASKEDAAVWEWMQKKSADGVWGDQEWLNQSRALADFVMTHHPQSRYALYTAFYLPMATDTDPSPMVAELVERFPNHSFTDQLKLILVQAHGKTSAAAFRNKDLRKAGEASDAARNIAADLIRNSRSAVVRKQAQDLLERTPTRKQLAEDARIRD